MLCKMTYKSLLSIGLLLSGASKPQNLGKSDHIKGADSAWGLFLGDGSLLEKSLPALPGTYGPHTESTAII